MLLVKDLHAYYGRAHIRHGVSLGALVRTSAWLAARLGRPSPSRVVSALAGG